MEHQNSQCLFRPGVTGLFVSYADSFTIVITTIFYLTLKARDWNENKTQPKHKWQSCNAPLPWFCSRMHSYGSLSAGFAYCTSREKSKVSEELTQDNKDYNFITQTMRHTKILKINESKTMNKSDYIHTFNTNDASEKLSELNANIGYVLYLHCVEASVLSVNIICSDIRRKEAFKNLGSKFRINSVLVDRGRTLRANTQNWQTTFVTRYELLRTQNYELNTHKKIENTYSASNAYFLIIYCSGSDKSFNLQCFDIILKPKSERYRGSWSSNWIGNSTKDTQISSNTLEKTTGLSCILYLYCFVKSFPVQNTICMDYKIKECNNTASYLQNVGLWDHGRIFKPNSSKWLKLFPTTYEIIKESQGILNSSFHKTLDNRSAYFLFMYCVNNVTHPSFIQCFDIRKLISNVKGNVSKIRTIDQAPHVAEIVREWTIENSVLPATPVVDDKMGQDGFKTESFKTQSVYFSIPLILSAVAATLIFLWTKTNRVFPLQEWTRMENERRIKLDEVVRMQHEMRERKRKRREELEREANKRSRETICNLINSLKQKTVDDARGFNEWMETPD